MSGWSPFRAEPEGTDEELARQARAGSMAAFEILVQRHEGPIYRFLRSCAGTDSDARELVQATFVAAYQALDQYRCSRAFGPWLFAIARHKFIDHHRARRSRGATEELVGSVEPTESEDPATLLSRREEASVFWNNVRDLVTMDQFQALWLHYHEDLSVREIAESMNRSVVSVKVLLFRARQILVQRLPADPEDRRASQLTKSNPAATSLGQTLSARTL